MYVHDTLLPLIFLFFLLDSCLFPSLFNKNRAILSSYFLSSSFLSCLCLLSSYLDIICETQSLTQNFPYDIPSIEINQLRVFHYHWFCLNPSSFNNIKRIMDRSSSSLIIMHLIKPFLLERRTTQLASKLHGRNRAALMMTLSMAISLWWCARLSFLL